jgi:hypothetical protein
MDLFKNPVGSTEVEPIKKLQVRIIGLKRSADKPAIRNTKKRQQQKDK